MEEDFIPAGMMGWGPPATEVFDGSDGMAPLRWTLPLAYAAIRAGIIYEGSRFELFRGQIIQTAEPLSPIYFRTAARAAHTLAVVFGEQITHRRGILPISEDTEVEPQLMVTRRSYREYTTAHPTPDEVLLIGEIAEGKARTFLLSRKAALYARAGFPEYWVLLPEEMTVLVHRSPGPDGYAVVSPYTRNDTIRPLAAPEVGFAVRDLLVPSSADRGTASSE